MITYSLICPTRCRIKGLERLFASLLTMTKNPSELELLFVIDVDDQPTIQFFGVVEHQHLYPEFGSIKYFVVQRSEFTNRDYYNYLANQATGKYLWAIADDLEFLIQEWDEIITQRIESYLQDKPDRIMCAGIRDSTPKPKATLPNFPCFPLITKEAFQFFGFLLHPQIPTWGADYLLYLLYTGARRYLEIRDNVYLNHISWHTGQATEDATSANIRKIFGRVQHDPIHNVDQNARNVVPQQVDQLLTHLRRLAQNG